MSLRCGALVAALLLLLATGAQAATPFQHRGGASGSAPPSGNSAQLLGLDTDTQGFWVGNYGADGYTLAGGQAVAPSYATVTVPSTSTTYGASDPTVLENPDGTPASSATWWNLGTPIVDVNITDGHPHKLSFYLRDQFGGTYTSITVKDGDSGATLLSDMLSSPLHGAYWTILATGHVTIGALWNGVFLDAPSPAVGMRDYAIASSGGPVVPLSVTTPSQPGASLSVTVASLPTNGTVTLADGVTPVTVSEGLTLAQLTGLKFAPSTLGTTAASAFGYTVSNGTKTAVGTVPISVEVVPSLSASSCTASGYEQAGSVTSDSGAMSVLVSSSDIRPEQVGVLVNDDNVLSIMTAHYFVAKHNIPPGNVYHFSYPFIQSELANYLIDSGSFNAILATIPSNIQMLALTFNEPYALQDSGNALGAQFFFGVGGIQLSIQSPYFTSTVSTAPFSDFGLRPTMFVTGLTLADALAVIDRGAASQATMPVGTGYFVNTTDQTRSGPRFANEQATVNYWTTSGSLSMVCKDNNNVPPHAPCSSNGGSDFVTGASDVLLLQGGWAVAPIFGMDTNTYVPGSEVDTVTSHAGNLLPTLAEGSSEGTMLSILHDGATGSWGSVPEPSNSNTRFVQASSFTKSYFLGGTLGEAVWKSVADPGDGNAAGDPLARPWGTTASFASGTLSVKTSAVNEYGNYVLAASSSCNGTYSTLQTGTRNGIYQQFYSITDNSGFHPFYKLTIVPPVDFSVSAAAVSPGGSLTVTIANGPAQPFDVVILSQLFSSAAVDFQYMNGTRTPPGSGIANATLNFTMPSTPGAYIFLFRAGGSDYVAFKVVNVV